MANQQNTGTNVPLPPGWEAKYSDQAKRYYFIDHVSKQTSWDDPRLSHPFLWGQQENVSLVQLKREFPNFPELVVRETLLKNGFKLQQSRSEMTAMAGGRKQKLQEDNECCYPEGAAPTTPGQSTTNALPAAKATGGPKAPLQKPQEDNECCYPDGTPIRITSSPAPKSETPYGLPAVQFALVSPRQAPSPQQQSKQIPKRDEFDFMSVKSKFPEVQDSVIENLLNQFGHDLEKTSQRLKTMGFKARHVAEVSIDRVALDKEEREKLLEKQRAETLKQIQLEFSSFPESVVAETFSKHNYDMVDARSALRQLETRARLAEMLNQTAVNVNNSFERERVASADKKKKSQKQQEQQRSEFTYAPSVAPTVVTSVANDSQQRSTASSSNAKAATQFVPCTPPLADLLNTRGVKYPVESKAQGKSESLAKGADPSLRRGPDKTLLSKDLPKACGPDPSLRCGPSKQLHSGPNVSLLSSSSFKA